MQTIIQEKPILIAGFEYRTSNAEAAQTIPAFWHKFLGGGGINPIQNKVSTDLYCIYTNFAHPGVDNEGTYSMIIGVEVTNVDSLPPGQVSVVISPSKRLVFELEGQETMAEKWKEVWGYNEAKKTFLCDYELYHNQGKVEIYVGIE